MTTRKKWLSAALGALAIGGLLVVLPLTSSAVETPPAAQTPPAATAPQPGAGYCGGAGGGMMQGGMMGGGMMGGMMSGMMQGGMMGGGMMQGTVANTVYTLTGLTKQEIAEQRRAGKSFVEIAKTKGITEEKLLEAVKKDHQAFIDQRVKDGIMTEEMAELCTKNFETNIKTILNNTNVGPKAGRGKGGRGFGGGMMKGWQQQAPVQAPAAQGQSV